MPNNPYTTDVYVWLTVAEIGAIVARCTGDYAHMRARERYLLRVAIKRLTKRALQKIDLEA